MTLYQTKLGQMIGVSRQTVSAELKRLQKEGLVTTSYGRTVVLKTKALQTYEERDCE